MKKTSTNSDTSKFLLLSHVFVNEGEEWKIDIMRFVCKYYNDKDPDITIILTGHGNYKGPLIDELFDKYVHYGEWLDTFHSNEFGKGHPVCVQIGLQIAKELGAVRVLKMRADTLSFLSDPWLYGDAILADNDKRCIVTAQTDRERFIGDLYMYGDLDFLQSLWVADEWNYNDVDGMVNLRRIFAKKYGEGHRAVQRCFEYVDCEHLKWVMVTPKMWSNNDIMNNLSTNYEPYLWDKHVWSYINAAQFNAP
jgi:hypothetical protein